MQLTATLFPVQGIFICYNLSISTFMKNKLLNIKNEAISIILAASDSKELEEIRLRLFGRNGTLTEALKEMAKLTKEEKPEVGRVAN